MKVVLLLELAKNTEMVDWRAAMLCWRVALTELKNTYCWIDSSICLCCVPWFNKQIEYSLEYIILESFAYRECYIMFVETTVVSQILNFRTSVRLVTNCSHLNVIYFVILFLNSLPGLNLGYLTVTNEKVWGDYDHLFRVIGYGGL